MKVKVCGITSFADAALALDHGADALGFNFYRPSPRYIDPASARSIVLRLPPFAVIVGVFVNVASPAQIVQAARHAGIQVLQLHGDESPAYCNSLSEWPVIKAVRIGNSPITEDLAAFPVRAFLLDSKQDHLFGGTGNTFDWTLAAEIKKIRPIILAGGLKPENVAEAIRAVQPYAVDVCSGVESSPGCKDARRLVEFMDEVRNASN